MLKVFLDPGHGGGDPGAIGNGLQEKDINLSVSLKIGEILKRNNIDVEYSRTTDIFVNLTPRANMANGSNADIFVSIHCNSFSDPSAHGLETFGYIGSVKGAQLAKSIQDSLVRDKLYTRNRGVKTANFSVLRNTKMPAALVELAFISNAQDADILRTKQDELALAIAKGILNYLNIQYVDHSNIVKIDFKGKRIDVNGFMKDDINYVQIRELFEKLGYIVDWDNDHRIVIIK